MPATVQMSRGRGSCQVLVPRSPDVVFDYVADLRHMTTWWPEHRNYHRFRGDGGRGAVYAWTSNSIGVVPLPGLTFVTGCEGKSRFSYRVVAPGLILQMSYRFTAAEGGTHVALEARSPMLRLKLLQRRFSEELARALDRLAATLAPLVRLAEPGIPPPAP